MRMKSNKEFTSKSSLNGLSLKFERNRTVNSNLLASQVTSNKKINSKFQELKKSPKKIVFKKSEEPKQKLKNESNKVAKSKRTSINIESAKIKKQSITIVDKSNILSSNGSATNKGAIATHRAQRINLIKELSRQAVKIIPKKTVKRRSSRSHSVDGKSFKPRTRHSMNESHSKALFSTPVKFQHKRRNSFSGIELIDNDFKPNLNLTRQSNNELIGQERNVFKRLSFSTLPSRRSLNLHNPPNLYNPPSIYNYKPTTYTKDYIPSKQRVTLTDQFKIKTKAENEKKLNERLDTVLYSSEEIKRIVEEIVEDKKKISLSDDEEKLHFYSRK